MNWIMDRLAVGTFDDLEALPPEITAVLSLCERAPAPLPLLTMIHAPIPDEVFLYPHVWKELTTCLAKLLASGHTVFVHCRLGVSRSPALCVAHLIQCGYAPSAALAHVQIRRPVVKIHEKTWAGVLEFWRYTHQVPAPIDKNYTMERY